MATPTYSRYATPTGSDPFGPYSAGDIGRANKQGWEQAGLAAGIGAGATAAQIGLSMIDTAQDTENKKKLAELRKHKGLTQAERADLDEQAFRNVKAMAGESQRRTEDALAASGQHSAASLSQARRDAARTLNEASIEAADIGIRENRAQVARDTQEEQERISYQSDRARQRIEMIGQAISGLAGQFGAVLAANPSSAPPSDAQIDAMRAQKDAAGRPVYPGLQDIGNDEFRANWTAEYRAGRSSRDGAGLAR